jgi:hypothetical protein
LQRLWSENQTRHIVVPVPSQDIRHMSWSLLCSVNSDKMRVDCSFCWYWWNWWPSLFKLSFHNLCKTYVLTWDRHNNVAGLVLTYLWILIIQRTTGAWGMDFVSTSPFSLLLPFFKIFI